MGEDLNPASLAVLALPASGVGPPHFFSRQLVVGKALLNSPPTKRFTESQQALASFLARERARYKSHCKGINTSAESKGGDGSNVSSPRWCVSGSKSTPAGLPGKREDLGHRHESKCILKIASLDSQTLYSHSNDADVQSPITQCSAAGGPQRNETKAAQMDESLNSSSDFAKLDKEELADRVVSNARLRRRNKRKIVVTQRSTERPAISLHNKTEPQQKQQQQQQQQRPKMPVIRTSTPVPIGSSNSTPFQSPTKKEGREEPRVSLSKSLGELGTAETHKGSKMAPKKVVFLSEKQSPTSKHTGVPNVPPSTPRQAGAAENVKIVPSMSDIKSQRELKNRLQAITVKEQASLSREKQMRHKRVDAQIKLKQQQRAEIYALNKVMAEYERERFELFMSGKI